MKKLELLAPARNLDQGKTAVDYGADALYVGGPGFGARAAAGNSVEDIARLVEYARPFGVRVYAALNALVFEDELAVVEKTARRLIDAGVDALIVQDMAFMRMGLEGVEFHASTQMCNASPEQVRFLQEAGFARVILERGLTLDEIRAVRAATTVDLECFVHGAICVGFSGQCYLSRTMGTRSGNRGDCMQACRLSYDLVDAAGQPVIRNKHLLSVLDLDLSARLGDLVDAGVTSFKIEGRLKDAGYVKNVVAHYRMALDRLIASRKGFVRSSSGRNHYDFVPDPTQSFTRGGSEWVLDGNRRGLASFDTPKATGALIGTVERVGRDSFRLSGNVQLTPGDGICFVADDCLTGTYINKVNSREVWPDRMAGIAAGTKIYRNHNKAFEDALIRSRTWRAIAVDTAVEVLSGTVSLHLTDEDGVSVEVQVETGEEVARDPAKMTEMLRVQVSKSGGTIFDIQTVEVTVADDTEMPFMPVSAVNELRRRATDALLAARMAMPPVRRPAVENRAFPYPAATLNGQANVTNTLAERFYRDHGVEQIDRAFDLRESLDGECVMTSAYCLCRELGECLREKPLLHGDMFLRRGRHTYRLEFDCDKCRMRIWKFENEAI